MALDKLNKNVEIIKNLGDNPNTDNNLSAEDLKHKFDEASVIIKQYINESLVPFVNAVAEAASKGLDPTLEREDLAAQAKAVGDQLKKMLPKVGGEVTGDLTVHRLNVKPKGEGYASAVRFANEDGNVRSAVGASTETGKVYVQNNCAGTEYSEYFFTPTQDENRTSNGNFTLLTTKEPVKISQGGTGANTQDGARDAIGAAAKSHTHTFSDVSGTVPLTKGGTGTGVDLANAPANAVIRKAGTGYDQLHYTATKSGAFFAVDENSAPRFGTLPIEQGGTNATTASKARENLGVTPANIGAAPSSHSHNISDVSGTVPLTKGGTGSSSSLMDAPKNALVKKIGDGTDQLYYTATSRGALYAIGDNEPPIFGTLPISQGGTNATSAEDARTNLGAAAQSHTHTFTDVSGTLPLSKGGTGVSTSLADAPGNAIIRKVSSGNYLYYTATKSGALYATSENGTPQFNTLPIKQGGTGATTEDGARSALKAPRIDLLWTNASPTSAFASQTLSLGLNDYHMYIVLARHYKDVTNLVCAIGRSGYGARLNTVAGLDDEYQEIRRAIDYSSGSLKFNDVYRNGTVNNDGYLVPHFIYGVRGVQTEV